ncbi:hypothetical protein EG328_010726 [Venturia inaequalis]|uniref:EthD domain-containing protein n=1 Tax=Venturia inaequalis TaxID=5025 RepID=A0A8H3U6W8_VENIN|nr:hypothetical protein EG328_010726 [Venturia inaequalis]
MADNHKPLIRVTVFNTRKPGLANAQYIEHWLTIHQKIAAHGSFVQDSSITDRYAILPEYNRIKTETTWQIPITPEDHALGASLSTSAGPVYDGMASFLVPSMEVLTRAFSDADYLSTVRPDEDLFIDRSGTKVVVGYEYVRIVDGKLV